MHGWVDDRHALEAIKSGGVRLYFARQKVARERRIVEAARLMRMRQQAEIEQQECEIQSRPVSRTVIHTGQGRRLIVKAPTPIEVKRPFLDVKRSVAEKYGVTIRQIESTGRAKTFFQPRAEACWIGKIRLGMSTKHIGILMGGRDHTSVIHAIRQYERWRAVARNEDERKKYDGRIKFEMVIIDETHETSPD